MGGGGTTEERVCVCDRMTEAEKERENGGESWRERQSKRVGERERENERLASISLNSPHNYTLLQHESRHIMSDFPYCFMRTIFHTPNLT